MPVYSTVVYQVYFNLLVNASLLLKSIVYVNTCIEIGGSEDSVIYLFDCVS